jgi:hypothetical protein
VLVVLEEENQGGYHNDAAPDANESAQCTGYQSDRQGDQDDLYVHRFIHI